MNRDRYTVTELKLHIMKMCMLLGSVSIKNSKNSHLHLYVTDVLTQIRPSNAVKTNSVLK